MESSTFSRSDVEQITNKWKNKKGNLIMVLHELQNKLGYVPRPASLLLSELLEIPLARIYEVITFYNYFKLEPPGKFNIAVCLGTACYLKGATTLLGEIKELLNIKEGETTTDGVFHLDPVRCLGCCSLAPVMSVNGKIYGHVAKKDIAGILNEYRKTNQ